MAASWNDHANFAEKVGDSRGRERRLAEAAGRPLTAANGHGRWRRRRREPDTRCSLGAARCSENSYTPNVRRYARRFPARDGPGYMALLIKNGEIVTSDARYRADICCQGQQITAVGVDLPAPAGAEVIDATGRYVFPGFIDPHVHIYLPFMGTYAKDTWQTASRAALVGGTTTLIEMICPAKTERARGGVSALEQQSGGQAACDYSFHMGVTRFDGDTESQLRQIVSQWHHVLQSVSGV